MNISERIKSIRAERGYNQRGMAEELNISQQCYSQIENDAENSKLKTLRKISTALRIQLTFLVSDIAITSETVKQNSL